MATLKDSSLISKLIWIVVAANMALVVAFAQNAAGHHIDKSCTEETASGPGGWCSTAGLDWTECEDNDDCQPN